MWVVDSEVEVAKKLVKKAAVVAAKKSSPTTKPAKSASKPANTKSKPVAASPSKKVAAPAVKSNAKPAASTAKASAAPAKSVAAKAPETAKSPAKNRVAGKDAAPKVESATRDGAGKQTKSAPPSPAKTKAGKVEPIKPSGKPMLLQGAIAIRPMGKKATLPPTPPKPIVKPVRKKIAVTGEPAFVVVQPPTKAVATSEKAAKNRAGLNQKDLDFFRDLLLAKRRELLGDMNSMEREALRENSTDLSNLPVHMADQGTDAYEQEFTLHLVEKDRTLLRELNDALAKIQNGTYGICEGTGLPISKPRLEAQPWARYSIEHARALEKRQMMFRR